jgi:hypothetical protein
MSHFIPFNVKILTKKFHKKDNWHIKDGFKYLLNDNILLTKKKAIFCNRCQDFTNHKESKQFYHTAKNLIIIFDREENFSNKEFINFDELLILNKTEAERYFEIKYKLVAVLQKQENSKENGEYESFMNYGNNNWVSNKNKQKSISLEEVKKNGITFALFYYSDDNHLILQADNIQTNNTQGNNYPNNNMINSNVQGMPNYIPGPGMPYQNKINDNMGFNNNNYIYSGMNRFNSGMINFNRGPNDMNRMNSFNGELNNFNRGPNNMNNSMNNSGMNNMAGGMSNNNMNPLLRTRSTNNNSFNNYQMNNFNNNNN